MPPPSNTAATLSSNQFLVEDFDLSSSREKSNQSDSIKASDLEDNKESKSADIDGISTLELSEVLDDIITDNQINKPEVGIDYDANNASFEYTISKRDAIEAVPGVIGGKGFDFEDNQDVVLLGTANFGTAYICNTI